MKTKLADLVLSPQVYTASNPNGTTTGKTFKVHLQLWDTAGQERWAARFLYKNKWAKSVFAEIVFPGVGS